MKLLFVCTHNRCRSILAEAITNHFSRSRITAASAGSSPQDRVHPLSLKFLSEHDISTQGLVSQSWEEFESFAPDAIVTLCDQAAEEVCPVWFHQSVQVHWGLQDPSADQGDEESLRAKFAHTIDVLSRRVHCLLDQHCDQLSGPALHSELERISQQIN